MKKYLLTCFLLVIAALGFSTACNTSKKDVMDVSESYKAIANIPEKSYDMQPYMLNINGIMYSLSELRSQNKGTSIGKVTSVVNGNQVPTENYSTNCPLLSQTDIFETEEGFLVESGILGCYILFTESHDIISSDVKSFFVFPQDALGS